MKKYVLYGIGIIILIGIISPFITGDLEEEVLNVETREQLAGSFIELSAGFTHFQLKGDENAKTVVLVHGNAAPAFTWDYNFDVLVDAGFRVLRYDLFGHGFSDRPDLDVYTRDLYDRQLYELMEGLEIKEPVYLVGTSQGGSICAYFAAKHPEKVAKIAFLSPLFDEFEGKKMASVLRTRGIGEYLMSIMGDRSLTAPSRVLYGDEKVEELKIKLKEQLNYKGKKRAVLANMRGDCIEDATPFYEEIKKQGIPVLLTWGENDNSISRESMQRLRQLIPEIEYHELKNASHLAHYEFPEKINPVLIDFLKYG